MPFERPESRLDVFILTPEIPTLPHARSHSMKRNEVEGGKIKNLCALAQNLHRLDGEENSQAIGATVSHDLWFVRDLELQLHGLS